MGTGMHTGSHYFVTFTDSKLWCTVTYFMKQKLEVLAKFKQYKSFVKTQTDHKLRKLHMDGGGEFLNKEFKNIYWTMVFNWMSQHPTHHHRTELLNI